MGSWRDCLVEIKALKGGELCLCLHQDRIQANNGVLTISNLNLADIGMYQCVAENKHGRIFTNAELQVIGKSTYTRL